MAPSRLAALPSIWKLRRRARRARRREAYALTRVGEALAAASGPAPADPAARDRLAALDAAARASLEADRAEYGEASAWARPLVVVRGLSARAVLRDRTARARRALAALHHSLGALADGGRRWAGRVPATLADAVTVARVEAETADAEVSARLAPLGGALLPPPLRPLAHRAAGLGRAVGRLARHHLARHAPALAGLAAGFWLARILLAAPAPGRSISIGEGSIRVTGPEAGSTVGLWLPLLVAAAGACLGWRLAVAVRRRYGAAGAPATARRGAGGGPRRDPPVASPVAAPRERAARAAP